MASTRWLCIQISIILYLSTMAQAKQASNHQLDKVFMLSGDQQQQQIIIDERSLRDDHFAYATCTFQPDASSMSCSLVLNRIYKSSISNKTCEVTRKVENPASRIDRDRFQLKYLFGSSVVFVWSEFGAVTNTVVRTLNMTDCRYKDTLVPRVTADRRELHVVPYADTYDLFYGDASACGERFMCGQTIDARGAVLNGPVPSYLNRTHFEKPGLSVAVGSVEHRSSRLGHFLLSNNEARLISAYGGRDTQLMGDPSDANYKAFSMEHGKLGLCYISKLRKHLTCRQFDRRGRANLTFSRGLDYAPGPHLAMYNLPKGGLLLATSECNEERWCRDNLDSVPFRLVKIQPDGGSMLDVLAFKGVNCNGADEVYLDVKGVTRDNAGVSVVCRVNKSAGEVHVNVAHYYVSI